MARRSKKQRVDVIPLLPTSQDNGPEAPADVIADCLVALSRLDIEPHTAAKISALLSRPTYQNVVLAFLSLHGFTFTPGADDTAQSLSFRLRDIADTLRPEHFRGPERRRRK